MVWCRSWRRLASFRWGLGWALYENGGGERIAGSVSNRVEVKSEIPQFSEPRDTLTCGPMCPYSGVHSRWVVLLLDGELSALGELFL